MDKQFEDWNEKRNTLDIRAKNYHVKPRRSE